MSPTPGVGTLGLHTHQPTFVPFKNNPLKLDNVIPALRMMGTNFINQF
jgi:hypothetical protein